MPFKFLSLGSSGLAPQLKYQGKNFKAGNFLMKKIAETGIKLLSDYLHN